MPLLISEQGTDTWLAARVGKITASVAAGCLGFDKHLSRAAAWRLIRGTPKSPNRHMNYGREWEPAARRDYETATGLLVTRTGFWLHPCIDWLGASPDGLVGDDGLVEIKCPGEVPAFVPPAHRIQMLIQLEVTGREWCDYFAWVRKQKPFLCRVHRCSGTVKLVRKLAAFREQYLLTGIQPPRKQRRKRGAA